MNYRKVGVWLAIIALMVNVPRFVLVFLRVDSIIIPLEIEGFLLGTSGIATGLVLTGGGAFIAHRLAESHIRGIARLFLALCWVSLLAFSVILLAPLLVSAIRSSPLSDVFLSDFSQWLWAIVAVLSVEVLAAGSVSAAALKETKAQEDEAHSSILKPLLQSLVRRVEYQIAPKPLQNLHTLQSVEKIVLDELNGVKTDSQGQVVDMSLGVAIQAGKGSIQSHESDIDSDRQLAKSERQTLLLEMLKSIQREDDIQVDELANHLGCSRQTIYRDIAELKKTNRLLVEQGRVLVVQTSN